MRGSNSKGHRAPIGRRVTGGLHEAGGQGGGGVGGAGAAPRAARGRAAEHRTQRQGLWPEVWAGGQHPVPPRQPVSPSGVAAPT